MHYEGNIIRPPSEAESIIFQVTTGCSHNKCTFCGVYKGTPFKIKDDALLDEDISFASTYCKKQNRVFLADGDVLILPFPRLLSILQKIKSNLPWVKKISVYGNAKAIRNKSIDELAQLKKNGLSRIYMGLESGHDDILNQIKKGENSESMILAGKKVRESKIFLSVTVLLGIAEMSQSLEHAIKTAETLNHMRPNQIAALTYMPLPNTEFGQDVATGKFKTLNSNEILIELYNLLKHIDINKSQFFANHASNYLPIAGRLPRDKEKLLLLIEQAISGKIKLKDDSMRAL